MAKKHGFFLIRVRYTAPARSQRKNPGLICNLGVVRRLQVTSGFFRPLAVGAVKLGQVKKRVFLLREGFHEKTAIFRVPAEGGRW